MRRRIDSGNRFPIGSRSGPDRPVDRPVTGAPGVPAILLRCFSSTIVHCQANGHGSNPLLGGAAHHYRSDGIGEETSKKQWVPAP